MGADIHSFLEIKRNGKWELLKEEVFPSWGDEKCTVPFGDRNYSVFAFLADVRNYSRCTPIHECKGLPKDSEYLNSESKDNYGYGGQKGNKKILNDIYDDCDYHSHSYLTTKELLDFDYDKTFENIRYTKTITDSSGKVLGSNGASIAEEGEGTIVSYRDYLGDFFFKELEILKTLGDPECVRLVFYFDN